MSEIKEISPDTIRRNTFKQIGKEWMLITAGDEEQCNTMTASWGGLGVMYGKNAAFIVIRPQRYTKEFVDREDTFSLSFLGKEYKKTLSYLGTASGRSEDKIKNSGLTLKYLEGTPYFDEAELVFICKKMFSQPLSKDGLLSDQLIDTWYPAGDFHTLYIAEITKVFQIRH